MWNPVICIVSKYTHALAAEAQVDKVYFIRIYQNWFKQILNEENVTVTHRYMYIRFLYSVQYFLSASCTSLHGYTSSYVDIDVNLGGECVKFISLLWSNKIGPFYNTRREKWIFTTGHLQNQQGV